MKKIIVNVLTFDEFTSEIKNNKFRNYPIYRDEFGDFYIKTDTGIEWQMLEDDLLVIFPDESIATISGENIDFV